MKIPPFRNITIHKRSIGIACATIIAVTLIVCMCLFSAARVGIPIGLGVCGLTLGAAWGLSK